MEYTTHSTEETIAVGEKIASLLKGGDVIILKGNLGAGKTTLVQGIAKGLGVTDTITSPTFAIMNVYPIKNNTLIHIDTYRLEHEEDLVEIGIEEYLGERHTICIIEWPEKIPGLLAEKEPLTITLSNGNTPTERIITVG
jgi:tRNA threonylcarbamoyladenosine biosynthesis protein TsaE